MRYFLLIFIFLSCVTHTKGNKNLLLFVLWNNSQVSVSTETPAKQAEEVIYKNSTSLISELGQFHYRGLNHPDKNYLGNTGKFHYNEEGDATFHTGVYLMALAWKYKNTQDANILPVIDRLLSYYELIQSLNSNGLARNIVIDEAYQKFPENEKNGNDIFQIPETSGNHMRYRNFTKNGNTYWLRYDISVDAISHALSGVYWTYKLVPDYKERCLKIISNQYDFYKVNNWTIKDDNGNVIRYGYHSPSINLFSKVNEIIFEQVLNKKDVMSSETLLLINTVPSYIKLKTNYFNSYIAFSQLLILSDLGYDVIKGITVNYNEVKSDSNYFANAVYSYVTKNNTETFQTYSIPSGHPQGKVYSSKELPLSMRSGYNKWEISPYETYINKVNPTDILGNEDFLQAYWLK